MGLYQATDVADNSVGYNKFDEQTSGIVNLSNLVISGITDGFPKIVIDIPNNKIKFSAGVVYNYYGYFRFNITDVYEYDYTELLGKGSSYILYMDCTNKVLKTSKYYNYNNISDFKIGNKIIILGIIFISSELQRVNFPEILQYYVYDENNKPFFYANSSVGAPLQLQKNITSFLDEKTRLRDDIGKLLYNIEYAHDINHPENFKIDIIPTEKKITLNSKGNATYLWTSKGTFYALNADYQDEISTVNYLNQTNLLYLNTKTKKLGMYTDGQSKQGLKNIVNTEGNILLAYLWLSITGDIVRLVPFDIQLDDIFYRNGTKYIVPRKVVDTNINVFIDNKSTKMYDISDIGVLEKPSISEADYSHIILYGQSLSMGWECPEAITTESIENCYMIGSSPMINHGNDQSLSLNPLKAVKWASGGEQPIVALTNSFATLYNNNHSVPQKFIGTNCGEGGRSIERLMKQCTNGTNYYTTEFLDTINSAKSAVDAVDKTISCPVIFFMQGEYNYTNLTGAGLEPDTDATNDKDQYKQYLMQLKNDMQKDIMEKYGQTKRPLFFIYQVAGNYINRKDMSITMAQIEFAKENEDVFLMNSTYGMPDYNGGHLSTNGYRWYGEMMAKSMYQVFENRKQWNGLELADIQVDGKQVYCDFRVPVLPLVFDNWTKESRTNNGFRIFKDNTEVSILDTTIIENRVVLITNTDLTGTIEITYAGQGPLGSGNLRDSDEYNSMYTYYDDRETSPTKRENYTPKDKEGNFIYGKKYPMYNWANHFYKKIIVD